MGHALRFLSGECTDERIREAEQVVAGTRFDECVLRTAIGERLLALGQRERAKVQFEKCIATDAWEFVEYNWAKAYLARMEKDVLSPEAPAPGKYGQGLKSAFLALTMAVVWPTTRAWAESQALRLSETLCRSIETTADNGETPC